VKYAKAAFGSLPVVEQFHTDVIQTKNTDVTQNCTFFARGIIKIKLQPLYRSSILQAPIFSQKKPVWMPFITLGITLFGILFQHWDLKPIVFMFWWEIILMFGAALIRMLCALDNRPPFELIFQKLGMLIFGVIMGGTMIALTVIFTIKAFDTGSDYSGLASVGIQSKVLTLSYLAGLIIHYFLNNRYKTASPIGELMQPFVHVLVLLSLLMVLTMHLIPKYPQLNQAMWVGVSVVAVKFLVDLLFSGIRKVMFTNTDINSSVHI